MRHALPALGFALIVLLAACGGGSPAPQVGDTGLLVDVSGSVIDPEEAPIAGARVVLNGHETTTDALGIFILRAVPVDPGRAYLEAHKEGYFFGGRQLLVVDDEPLAVKIQLLPRVLIGTFQADAGGVLRTDEGLVVQIQADAIEGGYQGEVRVYGRYVDPTSGQDMQGVPGLGATNAGGDTGVLRSFGMGHIELEDAQGNPLQLAAGSPAQLTMPVPADLLGGAQSTIPLWYFDQALGIWVEQGSATLQGETYVGDVPHFSLWNCDDFADCSTRNYFSLSCGGTPIARMPLVFRGVDSGLIGTSVTSDSGNVGTFLPCAEEFRIYVLPPGAGGEEFLLATVTASSDPEGDVELVPVDGLCGPYASVAGRVVDGQGNPVTNGYMFLEFDDLKTEPVFFDESGNFLASYFDYTPEQMASGARTVFWDLDRFIRVEGPVVPFNELLNTLDDPIVIDGDVATFEGRVYVAGIEQDYVYCLDSTDGSLIWEYEAPQLDSEFSPVLLNGRLYVLGLSGELFCLNAVDGTLIWSRFGFVDSFSAVAEDGAIYLSDLSARIRRIDPDAGNTIWSIDTGAGFFSAPTLVGDTVYCGTAYSAPGVIALDKEDGTQRWKWDAPDAVKSSPCVADGLVFVACDDQKAYALNAATGAVVWSTTVDDSASILGAVTVQSGVLYVQSVRRLTALNATSGAILWQRTLLSGGDGMRPYVSGDRVYANALGGPFYCFNAADGSTLWQIDAEGPPGEIADHFLVVNGVLFLNRYAEPSTLEARNAVTGAVLWTSTVADDLTAPPVVVDLAGTAHYTTSSGMRQ